MNKLSLCKEQCCDEEVVEQVKQLLMSDKAGIFRRSGGRCSAKLGLRGIFSSTRTLIVSSLCFTMSTSAVLFVSLVLDLLAFTLILPLMPSILDYYAKHDEVCLR